MESTSSADLTESDSRLYICDICGDTKFTSQRGLTYHCTVKHGVKRPRIITKKFRCNHCGKTFVNPSDLLTHSVMHMGEHPFECDICQRRFSHKIKLKSHKTIHSNDLPFICGLCGLKFKEMPSLHRHQLNHHQFDCQSCDKRFTSRASLRDHELIHSSWSQPLFKCPICHCSYHQRETVMAHRAAHEQGRVCNKEIHSIAGQEDRSENSRSIDHIERFTVLDEKFTNESHHSDFVIQDGVDKQSDPQSISVGELSSNLHEKFSDVITDVTVTTQNGQLANSIENKLLTKFGCNVCGEIFTGIDERQFKEHRASHKTWKRVNNGQKSTRSSRSKKQGLLVPVARPTVTSSLVEDSPGAIKLEDSDTQLGTMCSAVLGEDEASTSVQIRLENDEKNESKDAPLENGDDMLANFYPTSIKKERIAIFND